MRYHPQNFYNLAYFTQWYTAPYIFMKMSTLCYDQMCICAPIYLSSYSSYISELIPDLDNMFIYNRLSYSCMSITSWFWIINRYEQNYNINSLTFSFSDHWIIGVLFLDDLCSVVPTMGFQHIFLTNECHIVKSKTLEPRERYVFIV